MLHKNAYLDCVCVCEGGNRGKLIKRSCAERLLLRGEGYAGPAGRRVWAGCEGRRVINISARPPLARRAEFALRRRPQPAVNLENSFYRAEGIHPELEFSGAMHTDGGSASRLSLSIELVRSSRNRPVRPHRLLHGEGYLTYVKFLGES
ncbi:hypothetical protein EVAR_14848_1 [Eumeta japonica]|uniref:Uncharacterized protein n=1 Tax=Eumeta variegata TaxID=151549 RepID=A0A4C1V4G9_EUMVA|nr:hypothetical protein EVAR_14848_1 [Eumeta japonica]